MGGQDSKDSKIIQKRFHEIIQVIHEHLIHHSLIGRWCILEARGHHHPHKGPPIYNEGRFVMVFKSYLDLVVARKSIQNE